MGTDDPKKSGAGTPGTKKPGMFGRLFGGAAAPAEPFAEAARAEADDVSPAEAVGGVDTDDMRLAEDPTLSVPSDGLEVQPDLEAPTSPGSEDKAGGWFARLKSGLTKTSSKLSDGITGLFTKAKLDPETLEDFEDLLIQADLGVATATRITEKLSKSRVDKGLSPDEVRQVLAEEVERVLEPVAKPLRIDPSRGPHVVMMVGVNGTGKTTTIGKLASKYRGEGLSVMLAAGDTFRAAAIDQLKVWGERTGCEVVSRDVGSDSSGLAFDALKLAKAQGIDVLLVDTAGRLQNKAELMDELEKVLRVIKKLDPTAPHDVLLVLDATTGQNALQQVEVFRKRGGVTGLIMTKLDGTARGGILVAISEKYELPIHAIGVGEGIDDLQAFEPQHFAAAIAAT